MAAKTQVQVLVGVILFIKKLCFLWVRIPNHSLQLIHHLSVQSGKYRVSHSHSKFHRQVRIPVDAKKFFLLSFFSKSQRVTQRLRLKVTLRHLEKTKMAVLEKKPSRSKMAALEKKPSRSKMAANLNKKTLPKKKIQIQKIQHGGLRVQNKNKLRVRGPADPLRGSQNSASYLHKIPRIGLTYTLLSSS